MRGDVVERETGPASARDRRGSRTATGALTGTGTLVRFVLRRDRVKLPAWILGIGGFTLYYTTVVRAAYPTEDDIQAAAQLVEGPMGALYTGPGYGFDELTFERFVVGAYGLYFQMLAAVMSILLVSRHTRVEEQTGRSELVRANAVGRHAPLTAALLVAAGANGAVSVVVTATMAGVAGFGVGGSFLFGCGVGAVGLAFAGLTALTAQVTAFSRAAAGTAGTALGVSFSIRAVGDALEEHGSTLSWFSPLAWSQQTAPFVLDRWWPLALSLSLAAGTAAAGYRLSARRDLGAGLFAARLGPARAAGWLRTPFALALRLQRATILWWTAALTLAGVLFGAFAQSIEDELRDLPETLLTVMGGPDDVVDGYLALMALFYALVVGIFAILGVQGLRGEETAGRVEPVLATATSRWAWMGANLGVIAGGVLVMLLASGLGSGLGASVVTGDVSVVWELTLAALVHVPAVLLVLATGALLFGAAPRLVPATWALLGYAFVTGVFGALLEPPDFMYDLSPFEHAARMPLEPFEPVPVLVLLALTVGLGALGLAAFRRRGVDGT